MEIMFIGMKNQQCREKQNYNPAILLRKPEAEIFILFLLQKKLRRKRNVFPFLELNE
jgi:hypothetical protein